MTSPDPDFALSTSVPGGSTAALRRAVLYGALGLVVLAVVGVVVGWLAAGLPGVWGALLGAGIGGGFVLVTAVTVLATAKLPPLTAAAVLLGSWLLKMAIALIVLGVLNPLDFYSRPTLVAVMVGALVLVLGAETWGVLKSKMLYVEPATPQRGADPEEPNSSDGS
ncbi:hypothetical protein G4H71_02520 [Rhodococcus triatomae]|uniref:hypothetical protein n=1 Tax=Rhodococcus triatomae TaxID=300028 RepID=UPI000934F2B1|nr:hypothetical protein [Rhodococcus triatomae]QNG18268.1 hypothetical protein G4H72_05520 [Rhodococcus triatomae]QNG22061.1 hypothetical protein G4H71_02520 [Rhodococcus triatomae]